MISMDEAQGLVDRRLEVLAEQRVKIEDTAIVCPGTDVPGPELAQEIQRCCLETVGYVVKGEDLAATLNGMFLRMFWLGYAFGEARD